MYEIQKRSAGFVYDPEVLAREVANGVSGHDSEDYTASTVVDPTAIAEYLVRQELADLEVQYMLEEFMSPREFEPAADTPQRLASVALAA